MGPSSQSIFGDSTLIRDDTPTKRMGGTFFFNPHVLHYVYPYALLLPCSALELKKDPIFTFNLFFLARTSLAKLTPIVLLVISDF
jgi:hypothetical protein